MSHVAYDAEQRHLVVLREHQLVAGVALLLVVEQVHAADAADGGLKELGARLVLFQVLDERGKQQRECRHALLAVYEQVSVHAGQGATGLRCVQHGADEVRVPEFAGAHDIYPERLTVLGRPRVKALVYGDDELGVRCTQEGKELRVVCVHLTCSISNKSPNSMAPVYRNSNKAPSRQPPCKQFYSGTCGARQQQCEAKPRFRAGHKGSKVIPIERFCRMGQFSSV